MTKLLSNQISAILWGARDLGRSVALALARNGSAVALTDPAVKDLEKIRDHLLSKHVDVLALPWGQKPSGDGVAYHSATADAWKRIRSSHPFLHRVILPIGTDSRFWTGSSPEFQLTESAMRERLEGVWSSTLAAMKAQDRPGRITVLWPLPYGGGFDSPMEELLHAGVTLLRKWIGAAAEEGIGGSLLLMGRSDIGIWSQSPPVSGSVLRGGEIGDAVVSMETLPRHVWLEEAIVRCVSHRE